MSQVSEFPVILSLENHCSMEQQRVMAQLLDTILGDMLLREPLDGLVPQELPSPQVRPTLDPFNSLLRVRGGTAVAPQIFFFWRGE